MSLLFLINRKNQPIPLNHKIHCPLGKQQLYLFIYLFLICKTTALLVKLKRYLNNWTYNLVF